MWNPSSRATATANSWGLGVRLGDGIVTLWVEETLHHQKDCWNPMKNGINRLSTAAGFLNHPQYLFIELVVTLCLFSMGMESMAHLLRWFPYDDFHSYVSLPEGNSKVNFLSGCKLDQISRCGGYCPPMVLGFSPTARNTHAESVPCSKKGWSSNMGVSDNSVPLNPVVLLIIIPFLNGYFIGNIPYFQINNPNLPSGELTKSYGKWP